MHAYYSYTKAYYTLIGQDRDQYHIYLVRQGDIGRGEAESGKVIVGEAKPSPNITLSDQINMILGEVLSNKCFIVPAHIVCTQSIARFIDSDQEAIYQIACSAPLYKFAYCVMYFRT